jgi:hypothetical protein
MLLCLPIWGSCQVVTTWTSCGSGLYYQDDNKKWHASGIAEYETNFDYYRDKVILTNPFDTIVFTIRYRSIDVHTLKEYYVCNYEGSTAYISIPQSSKDILTFEFFSLRPKMMRYLLEEK